MSICSDSTTAQHGPRRLGEDREINQRGMCFNIAHIKFEPISPVDLISSSDLGESGEARLDHASSQAPAAKVCNRSGQQRTRSNERHLTAHDVHKARQFV